MMETTDLWMYDEVEGLLVLLLSSRFQGSCHEWLNCFARTAPLVND